MRMFRRAMNGHSLNVKVVRDQSSDNAASDTDQTNNPFEGVEVAAAYAEVIKDVVTHTALVIVGAFAACKIVERICR